MQTKSRTGWHLWFLGQSIELSGIKHNPICVCLGLDLGLAIKSCCI